MTAQQIMEDIGLTIMDEPGRDFEFRLRRFDLINWGIPGHHITYAQVLENNAVLVQLVVIIEVT